jgi:hypothetical protein
MKSNFFIHALVIAVVILSGCEKKMDEIAYPEKGNFGENILRVDSVHIISSGDASAVLYEYSLRAELPAGTSIRVLMKKTSSGAGNYSFRSGAQQGWAFETYFENKIQVTRLFGFGQDVCDIKVIFTFTGSLDLEIYENADTLPTRTKTLSWQE